ncbi:MAG TPA: bacteriohopanetetrol glucosamine biosynthesis glycosyltransferase HpnI [Bryobacteraceae bacterium]|jgi:ceramide glucosyltransferase|nr:bacteriohopanetetrol glucosamine biosynthesis glycosyltransferase HpnI [Bryobacteraceae bacterium]
MNAVAALLVVCGAAYNLLAIIAAIRFRRQRPALTVFAPPVSILKPVRGRDAHFHEAIRSHAAQYYPQFELLFGTADPNDPALDDIASLRAEFPNVPIRVVNTNNDAPNGKVGSLEILAREARHDVLLVNDGDIRVEPGYLARVIGLLAEERVGLVTCLYRGRGASLASRAEALGIATEFAPSVLVARLISGGGFALGSTMAFRRADLEAIGGFAAIREYLADDYQLGARIAALGKRVALSCSVVETNLGAGSWGDVWKHQVRWSRTIRVSRPAGYFGYAVTQLTFWCVVAALLGQWRIAAVGLTVRLIAAATALSALGSLTPGHVVLSPCRDLFGFAVWAAGMAGREVEWRGIRFELSPDGRIRPL